MGLVVPVLLFYLLDLHSLTDLFIVSATCFFSWGVADLVGEILSRPRLKDRSPSDALKNIDLTTKQARQRNEVVPTSGAAEE